MFLITAILALTLVSAGTLTQSDLSETATLGFTGNATLVSSPTINNDATPVANIAPTPGISGNNITLSLSPTVFDNLYTAKSYTGSYIFNNGNTNTTHSLTIIKSFCSNGSVNDSQLDLTIEIDVDSEGDGDEGNWYPRDIVEVEVDFDNDLTDLDDVYFELGLFDITGNDIAEDLDWIEGDEKEKIGDVDDGDDDAYTFKFAVPNDVDDGAYRLVIKAYEDDNEEGVCIDYDASGAHTQTVELERESDDDRLVIFEDLVFSTNNVACGSDVTLSTTMYNIGSDKQEAIKANLYSSQLGIDLYSEAFTKFDTDDKQELEFVFTTPTNASEGTYKFSIVAYYDWDEYEDEDETYNDAYFDEKSDAQKISLTLDGKCTDSTDADIEIGVVLSEDTPVAKAGKQVILETTIENTGTGTANYEVSVTDISEWAKATIEDADFTLEAGESKVVEIVLDVDNDVEAGEKELTIETTYGGSTNEQKVLLDVEEGFSLGFGSIGSHFQDNWFIYTVILVDIILIVAIIIAVVRVANKPSA